MTISTRRCQTNAPCSTKSIACAGALSRSPLAWLAVVVVWLFVSMPAGAQSSRGTVLLDGETLAAQWADMIDGALIRAAQRRTSAGSRFVTAVQSSIETAFVRLLESAIVVIPRALAATLVLLAFWLLASLVRWIMRIVFRQFISDLTVENLIKQVGYYTVWALGLVVAAGAFGIEPEDFATGLGLTSIALGFALKDILSNFVRDC